MRELDHDVSSYHASSLLDQRGQSTVELAFCLPVLALVLAALVEIGMLVSDQTRLWHAAREAARVAVVDPERAPVIEAVERGGLKHVEVSIDPGPAYRVQGRPLTVNLSYRPDSRVPLLAPFVDRIELHARAAMRIEQP